MRAFVAVAVLALCGVLVGCENNKPKVESIEAPPPNPVAEAKAILNNYANGMPVTSEAESFPDIVQRVRQVDSAKADILDKGFKEILANKQNPGPKARELLKKL
ncbi:MAG: hypothetical protein J0I06_01765 [Planctomycetes bacterium]|nr:hypothetical protein [Planctomycetota bacterium]